MLVESINTIKKRRSGKRKRLHEHIWLHGLPFKVRFRKSHLYISVIPPLFIGFFVGILSSIMGVGGGFILVPAMIYILGMPTQIVVGTSLLQIVFVTGVATILHSYVNQTLDVMLSSLLLLGAVIGAQIGTKIMVHLNGEQIRFLLSPSPTVLYVFLVHCSKHRCFPALVYHIPLLEDFLYHHQR